MFERTLVNEPVLTHAPLAIFEGMSPEDRMPRMLVKLKDYESMGVPTIMLIDPPTQVISRFVEGELVAITEDVQQVPDGVCSIDWRQVREFLDD